MGYQTRRDERPTDALQLLQQMLFLAKEQYQYDQRCREERPSNIEEKKIVIMSL